MLNGIWIAMVLVALAVGALTGRLDAVSKAVAENATGAVTLALGLVGIMAFFLGLMRVLQEGGLLRVVARALKPIMVRLFPDVPGDHPAMSMMILNFTANMLGLANAATPFGLKAMMELDKLNPEKGTATNAMALFLAINTSNLALIPSGVIGLRTGLGAEKPASIFLPTLVATAISTVVAIIATKLFIAASRSPAEGASAKPTQALQAPSGEAPRAASAELPGAGATEFDSQIAAAAEAIEQEAPPATRVRQAIGGLLVVVLLGACVWAAARQARSVGWPHALRDIAGEWVLVLLVAGFVLYGFIRGVKVYDAVVEGGKEGFAIAVRIIPFLVAILVAVGMLRASGAIDAAVAYLQPVTSLIGMPAETLPMVLLRPLSGSGAYGVAADIMKVYGTDSLIGNIVSTMQGSSETTFYVLAVYYGAVQVRSTRFTVAPCLIAEAAGMIAAVWAVRWILF